MNFADGESNELECETMERIGGRLVYGLCIFGMP